MSNIKKIDQTFEYFLLLATILQSVLFQLLTWLLKFPDESNLSISFALIFTIPYLISLILWIYTGLDNLNNKTLNYRIISWAATEAGLAMSIIILAILGSIRFFQINVNLGIISLFVGIFALIPFNSFMDNVLNQYKKSTPNYPIWRTWKRYSHAKLMSILVYAVTLVGLTWILWFWSLSSP